MSKVYLELLNKALIHGESSTDRTGTGTRSIFGGNMVFDLREGFPLLTTKKLHWKSIVHELLWFISGTTSTAYLSKNGITIWDEWADEKGELGPIYGYQWRNWPKIRQIITKNSTYVEYTYVDQLQNLIEGIKNDPKSRRHIVSAWNVADINKMALPPCHMIYQCYVSNDGYLDLLLYQRSCDMFLGVPYNIASYSLLLSILSIVCKLTPRYFTWVGGDIHIYNNHIEQVKEQLKRDCTKHKLPSIKIIKKLDIDSFTYEDIDLVNYESYPHIKADISI